MKSMRSMIVAILLGLSAVAVAKPLPAGMKIAVAKQQVMVSQGGATVPLFADVRYPVTKVVKAELSDDGASLKVLLDACENLMNDADEGREVPLAEVQARLENAIGMSFHLKKKYADAITHFTAAVAADPRPVYVTNLLSAQARAGKLDDADKTLATWGKKLAPWIVWRLAVDADLKKLAGRPSAKLAADKPGKATSKLAGNIALSPLGFAAAEVVADMGFEGGPGGPTSYELVVVELSSGNEVLRLPTETVCDESGFESAAETKKCKKREAAAAAKNRKVVDPILATLGFETAKDAAREAHGDDEIKTPEGKAFTVPDDLGYIENLWLVPKLAIYSIRKKLVTDCSGTGELHMVLTAKPRP
jgi:hypothetical protein